MDTTNVTVQTARTALPGDLTLFPEARGVVVFAHGSGSSRLSPRNRAVAEALNRARFATLLFDLLDEEEEARDRVTGELRFDIELLGERLTGAVDWLTASSPAAGLPVALFGASTGAAAALITAAARPETIHALVSRGGRPDLADNVLETVRAPVLLVVGGADDDVLALNQGAMQRLYCPNRLHVVPGASHLFTEPGALDEVCDVAIDWLDRHVLRP
ncbi:dienelactone hydrolase family protein [Marinactinospora thermotolerans]|uniref:Alpha/beta hydrolase family protein n=1 Tax=Marinactinospora thermotolerans DSM 45154 TaxID=1122192 RepID=A0A1T4NDT9_9ACTN|nr:dienelactone hydrolase family protein [Marinactinospora thermotolerans]SJZ77303.1 Alpha/beta hydrolase family protein [Marinactinospora thermotolerans DSM 45154]